ncbi:MSS4, partial [Acrasis kona]
YNPNYFPGNEGGEVHEVPPKSPQCITPQSYEETVNTPVEDKRSSTSRFSGLFNQGKSIAARIGSLTSDTMNLSMLKQFFVETERNQILLQFNTMSNQLPSMNCALFSTGIPLLSNIKVEGTYFGQVLFDGFDARRLNVIEILDFEQGLGVLLRGSVQERTQMTCRMFDPRNTNAIDKNAFSRVILSAYEVIEKMVGLDISNQQQKCDELFFKVGQGRPYLTGQDFERVIKANQDIDGSEIAFHALNLLPDMKQRSSKRYPLKTPSEMASFGQENFQKMLNLMIGIRLSQDYCFRTSHAISDRDCYEVHSYRLPYSEVQFVDHAPLTFSDIRRTFNVMDREYAMAFGPEQLVGNLLCSKLTTMSEKITDGKSGNFFYHSHDGYFLCKTISNAELNGFKTSLSHYSSYCRNHPNTLLAKYYGLHEMNMIPIVVMANVFETNKKLNLVFDLKGSRQGRTNTSGVGALKDLDWIDRDIKLNIAHHDRVKLMAQIEKDVEFLQTNRIIDYSLLLGIHQSEGHVNRENDGGVYSEDGRQVYYMGIIDTLVVYGNRKALEHHFKGLISNEHSVVPPSDYASRFLNFVKSSVLQVNC